MAAGEPRVRAWWGKSTLARVRAHEHGSILIGAVGHELVDLIEHSTRLTWIPMSTHAAMCERLIAQVGPRKFVAIMSAPDPDPAVTANMQARLDSLGQEPLVLLKHTASMWADVAIDAGTLTVTSDSDRSATLSFENLPPTAMGGWLKLTLEALVERALRATLMEGKITVAGSTASRMLSLHVTW